MKTRIFLFILLCLTLANINAQNNKDDLSNSKELTGIWEINLGDSYETVKAVMKKRGWTAKPLSSNEKKLIKNRELLGLDSRPTYSFKKQNGTFANLPVDEIEFSFYKDKLYNICLCFTDDSITKKRQISQASLPLKLSRIYSLSLVDEKGWDGTKKFDSYTVEAIGTIDLSAEEKRFAGNNKNEMSYYKFLFIQHFPNSPRLGNIVVYFLRINISNPELREKAETERLQELAEEMKNLNGILETKFGDDKNTTIASMQKCGWSIKSRKAQDDKVDTIIFSKIGGTFAFRSVDEIQMDFYEGYLDRINIRIKQKDVIHAKHWKKDAISDYSDLKSDIIKAFNLIYIDKAEKIITVGNNNWEWLLKTESWLSENKKSINFSTSESGRILPLIYGNTRVFCISEISISNVDSKIKDTKKDEISDEFLQDL